MKVTVENRIAGAYAEDEFPEIKLHRYRGAAKIAAADVGSVVSKEKTGTRQGCLL